MAISRRDFLKTVAGGSLLLAAEAGPAAASMPKELPPEAVGILYDATLCIGCKSCMVNCKTQNSVPNGALFSKNMTAPPYEIKGGDQMWDMAEDLSGKTLNVIKAYRSGSGLAKDTAENGYSFVKQHCLHCISPACVSVCPVAALKKDPKNGVVYYEEDRCIGCRYCQLACPFRIPRYEWDKASPQVRKCQLCRHRFAEGKYSACCESCPTGASIFGRVVDLKKEAERRMSLKPGSTYDFPLQTVDGKSTSRRTVATYMKHVYGLNEAGGTQYLLLAGVPFEMLGFDKNLQDRFLPDLTWAYVSKIPAVIVTVLVGGAATWAVTSRRNKDKGE